MRHQQRASLQARPVTNHIAIAAAKGSATAVWPISIINFHGIMFQPF